MGAIVDLVLIPLTVAAIGGQIAGPWGVFLGLVVGLTLGAARGRREARQDELEELQRAVNEKDQRIAELEQRIYESDDE